MVPLGFSRDAAIVALEVPGFLRTESGGGRYGFRSLVTGCSNIVVLNGFSFVMRLSGLPATAVDWPLEAWSMPSAATGAPAVSSWLLMFDISCKKRFSVGCEQVRCEQRGI